MSKKHTRGPLVGCAVVLGIGLVAYADKGGSPITLACLGVVGLMLAAGWTVRSMVLCIDETGFTLTGGWRKLPRVPWTQAANFMAIEVGSTPFIAYQWTTACGKPEERCLPGRFDICPETLAALLNVCRDHFLGT